MDRILILHIGPPKTGTTTLQELVFPQLTHIAYFDRDRTPASSQFISAFMGSPEIWRLRGASIFRQLQAEKAEGSVLVSAASMSTHRFFAPWTSDNHWRDPFLLAAHLRECQVVAQRADFDCVKVIMGIRRQDQYLASRYATHGWLADRPGQDDFERQALEIIDPEKRYFMDGVWLDYKVTHDLIAGVVGLKNVLLLPLEQLAEEPSRYLSTLSAFLGEPLNLDLQTRKKVRMIGLDTWQIREMKKVARKKRFGRIRAPLLARNLEIRLSPELKAKILAAYYDSNQRLASTLNLGLARYDYYGIGCSVPSSLQQCQRGTTSIGPEES
jgi:hypothetical protein